MESQSVTCLYAPISNSYNLYPITYNGKDISCYLEAKMEVRQLSSFARMVMPSNCWIWDRPQQIAKHKWERQKIEITENDALTQRHKILTWKPWNGENHGSPQTPNKITILRLNTKNKNLKVTTSSSSLSHTRLQSYNSPTHTLSYTLVTEATKHYNLLQQQWWSSYLTTCPKYIYRNL